MNSRTTTQKKNAKWQNIVIIFILLFMIISALPNLYSDRVNVQLINNSTQSETIAPQDINALLTSNNLMVDEIKTSTNGSTITLKNKTDKQAIEKLLTQEYGNGYAVESSVENDSPAWLKSLNGEPIKLGLDLSGGVLFVLDVDTERALSDRLKSIALDVKTIAIDNRIRLGKVSQANNHSIIIDFSSAKQSASKLLLTKISNSYPELTQKKPS